jgi:hypothetical protein
VVKRGNRYIVSIRKVMVGPPDDLRANVILNLTLGKRGAIGKVAPVEICKVFSTLGP